MTKGMSVDECVRNAEVFISRHGLCLLIFDVRGSSGFEDKNSLISRLHLMMDDLNERFYGYFPENNLAVYSRREQGFQFLFGDASWAGINSSDVIPDIIKYQKEKYPDIPLYWGVARNGYDEENTKIAKL